MKPGKIVWGLLLCLLLLLSACDDKKDDFSGLSDLVEDRNELRKNIAAENVRKKALEEQPLNKGFKETTVLEKEKKNYPEISPIVLYEREVEVVDSLSKRALAKGIAYLNKQGQIVKIKIVKE